MSFQQRWAEAAYTSIGFFWMALWAFVMGYIISSVIQVFVTEARMRKAMGKGDARSIGIGTFFGFISSSCSFAALATTKSLFQKGASFAASIAFLLASTNLVIELGIVILIFLGWQFVVGEYIGGILLVLLSWLLIRVINPKTLIKSARARLKDDRTPDGHAMKLLNPMAWAMVGQRYVMEWKMVWKDVLIGFTVAGIISAFVPDTFFRTLFINTGDGVQHFGFLTLLQHVIIGPVAAFLTFIGSMGNIPLAALLFGKGVSFAGVMAFIFSDLVVFPVLRINAKYYGWKMSLFILGLLLVTLVTTSLLLHYGLDIAGMLPQAPKQEIVDTEVFKFNYTFYLNLCFLAFTGILIYVGFFSGNTMTHHHAMASKGKTLEQILKWLAVIAGIWLTIGIVLKFTVTG